MIYVSSSCVNTKQLKDAVRLLHGYGFSNIELTGGLNHQENFSEELIALKRQYGLNILLHNYFLPPMHNFTLNLASLNEDVFQRTKEYIGKAIKLSQQLDLKFFSFHAGFFIDIDPQELGYHISFTDFYDKKLCIKRFCEGYQELKSRAGNVKLYIENNVISKDNFNTFRENNPFMLTHFAEYRELRNLIDFKFLLDVGHLKISTNVLGLSFEDEFNKLTKVTDYIHISGNDGFYDQGRGLCQNSDFLKMLHGQNLQKKIITLEIRNDLPALKKTYDLINRLI